MNIKRTFATILAACSLIAATSMLPASAADEASASASASVAAASADASAAAVAAPAAAAATPVAAAPAAASAAASAPAAAAAPAALVPNKGDTSWLLVSTAFVILMTLPGLGLFYGGLVRSKNMLSVLMQCFTVFSLIIVLWILYGYSIAFTEGNSFFGGFSRLFLHGMTPDSVAATFSKGVVVPEFAYVVFQGAFAAITCALIIGAFAERAKFSAILVFTVLWFTFAYLPMAHMVWYWPGPDGFTDAAAAEKLTATGGWLFQKGALDFAGGTVVHINAAIAGLVGSYVIGKRATAAAVLSWSAGEWIGKGKPSMLGGASGAVAGLVAITPAAGFVGPMGALVMGLLAGFVCLWGVTGLKRLLGADDALDVFGVHGVGGILGALLTGVFAAPSLGGVGIYDYVTNAVAPDYSIPGQLWIQFEGVLTTLVWSGLVSLIAFKLVDIVMGLRVTEEEEREGLDISSHGESAYHD